MRTFSAQEAKQIGDKLKIDWATIPLKQFQMGLSVELEHGSIHPKTNVTDDSMIKTGKIALVHIQEDPKYYTKLKKVELESVASVSDLISECDALNHAHCEKAEKLDLYKRAAEVLTIGLHRDLPEDLNEAADFVRDVLYAMYRKRPLIIKALQQMGRVSKAKQLTRQLQKEY